MASTVMTIPVTAATANAYACRTPRRVGLPRSTGRRRLGAMVTNPGYGTVGYWQVMLDTGRVNIRDVGWSAALVECSAPLSVAAWLTERLDAVDIVPGERTVLVDGASAASVSAALA